MAIKFSNLASTTLASGVSDTATSLSVTSASLFPTLGGSDYFYATIGTGSGSEIVKVTAISGTTFTVVRGQDGTTAISHSSGAEFSLRVTAAALNDLSTQADTESVSIAGDTMTGNLSLGDNVKLQLGNQTNGDLQIYHDGSASRIVDAGTGSLKIQAENFAVNNVGDTENMITAEPDGAVALFHNGSPKIATTSTGTLTTGDVVNTGGLYSTVNNSLKIIGGGNASNAGSNLTLYGGTNASAGTFRFRNGTSVLTTITPTGIDVTGSVVADGLTSELGSDAQGKFSGWSPTGSTATHSGAIELGQNASYQGIISYDAANDTRFIFDNSWSGTGSTFEFRTNTAATAKTHLKIEGNGDISFYNDSAAQGLFWDSSTSRLGLGTTVSQGNLTISNAAGANAPSTVTAANTYLQLGSDDYGSSNNGKFMIGLGYTDATNTNSPAYIGFEESSTLGDTKGDLTFYTRNVITDTAPTKRLTINADGSSVFSGAVTSTGLTVNATTPVVDILADSNEDASLRLRENGTGIVGAEFTYDGGDNYLYLKVGNNTNTKRLAVSRDTGDISFYEDTGTTPKLFWDASTERLGLGTVLPQRELEVTGSGNVYIRVTAPSATDSSALELKNTTEMWTIRNDDTDDNNFKIQNDSGTKLVIDRDTGRLGIGTTSPAQMLNLTSDGFAYARLNNSSYTGIDIGQHTNGNTYFNLRDNKAQVFFTNNTERLSINADGSSVFSGSVTSTGLTASTSGNQVLLLDSVSGATSIQMRNGSGSINTFIKSGVGGSSNLKFETGSADALTLDASQNVNIPNGKIKVSATTAPVARVDIAGNSDTVPALKIGSGDTYGHFFYDSGATGDLVIKRGEGGSQSESMRLDRSTGNATFSGDVVSQSSFQIFKQSAGAASVLLQRSGATNPWYLAQGNTATNYFEIMEGSTPRFTIANGGNATFSANVNIPNGSLMVGSTTAPSSRFHLKSASRGSVALRVTDSDTTNDILRSGSQPDGDGYLQLRTVGGAGNVLFDASGDSYVNGGNFGIGTSSPTGELHIAGSGSTVALKIDNTGTGGDTWRIWSTNDVASDGGGKLGFYNEDTATRAMTFDSAGNVGIGTSSPSAPLTVNNNTDHSDVAIFHAGGGTPNRGLKISTFSNTNSNAGVELDAQTATGAFKFSTGGTERMRIDSSGRVGIGVVPAYKLHISGATNANDVVIQNSSHGVALRMQANTNSMNIFTTGSKPLYLGTNNTTNQVVLDTSGNLLVGKTSSALQNAGVEIRPTNLMSTRINGDALSLNRRSSDGAIASFYRDGVIKGAIGSDATHPDGSEYSGATLYIGAGDAGLGFTDSGDFIYPYDVDSNTPRNGTITLGHSSTRFKDLYLSGTANANKYAHDGDSDTYFNFPAANQLSLVAGGAEIVRAYQIAGAYGVLRVNGSGSATYPNFTFNGDDNTGMYRATTDTLAFTTGGQEAARIDASQNLLVGKTSSSGSVAGSVHKQSGQIETTVDNTYATYWNRITSDGVISYFSRDGVVKGSISISGSSTSYNTSSDERLKDNIKDSNDSGSKVDAIQVRQFDWKADGTHQDYGMVAQELQSVAPEAVSVPEDSEEMMGVDYSKLVPMLIKEIQSLRQRVAQLEE